MKSLPFFEWRSLDRHSRSDGARVRETTFRSMEPKDLTEHVTRTYRALRSALVVIAFALPPLLWLGGRLKADLPLQDSLSAYYHRGPEMAGLGEGVMRDYFVGLLFAVGFILFVYQGYTRREDWALNFAGLFALGVALFPTPWDGFEAMSVTVSGITVSLHHICAVSLFACIGYVCIRRASDTLGLLRDPEKERKYRMTYKTLGWLMIGSPVLAFVVSGILHHGGSMIFFLETAGIYVFAIYWLVKSRELRESDAEKKAVHGMLRHTEDPKRQIQEK